MGGCGCGSPAEKPRKLKRLLLLGKARVDRRCRKRRVEGAKQRAGAGSRDGDGLFAAEAQLWQINETADTTPQSGSRFSVFRRWIAKARA